MNLLAKLSLLNIWNIGFIERPTSALISNDDVVSHVKWLKHPYRDRFFADPFILSISEDEIEVLVEEFLYTEKKGKITKLIIDKDYSLLDKQIIGDQPYHQSFPFILKAENQTIVIPEASRSGNLFAYHYDKALGILNQKNLFVDEPLLDPTLFYHNDRWWLFAHKKDQSGSEKLHIYHSKSISDHFVEHPQSPKVKDNEYSRPAGAVISINKELYRVCQISKHSYGEAVRIWHIKDLNPSSFKEIFVKDIRLKDPLYNQGFHTLNGMGSLTVIDGLKTLNTPIRRISYEMRYRLNVFKRF